MAYTNPVLTTGSFPNQVWDYAGINALIENSNLFATKAFYQNNPAGSVSLSAIGLNVLQNYSMASNNLPSVFTFQAALQFSAVVPQFVKFYLFRNGTQLFSWAYQLITSNTIVPNINIAVPVPASASPTTDSWDVKWQISAGGVTVSMPTGYRIVHYQV